MKKNSSNSSNGSSATRLAEWSSALSFDDVPGDARRVALRCMIDFFAVGIGGAKQEVAKKSRDLAFAEYGNGNSTVFGSDCRLATTGAAMANGTAAHALDFDDTCYAGITHGTAVIGPAVFAIAEKIDSTGRALLTAFIAGSEIAYTLGKATGNSVYYRGWWGTTIYGTIGAAAGAAHVLSLNMDETSNAIALATLGTGGTVAGLGTDAKPLTSGFCAATGVRAALLAKAGISAPKGIFEDSRGFAQMFNGGVFDTEFLNLIGQVFGLVEPGIFIKPYPSCTASHAALEATDQSMTSNNLTANDVERIKCHVPKLVDISLIYDSPNTPQQGQFSMQFTLACMLARRRFGVDELTLETLNDPIIRNEMAKVTMLRDVDLTKRAAEGEVGPECTRIEIVTKDGRYLKTFNSVAIGAPTKPMSADMLDSKFYSLAKHAGLGNKANTLLERLHNLENIESIRTLF